MSVGFAALGYRLPRLFDPTPLPVLDRRRRVDPYAPAYPVPEQQVHEAPELVQQLHELHRMTEWTNRTLGEVIGVSHPTIAQALRGNAGALSRSATQRQRLADAYTVVSRIFLLAGRDASRTAAALDTLTTDDMTAIDLLSNGQVTRAYLAATRALRPPRIGEMITGAYPLDPRTATVAVLDED